MSHGDDAVAGAGVESVLEEYVLDVRIVERTPPGDEAPRYRFEAPEHTAVTFEDPDLARLYADVYFDVNGFVEAGTGERGVPPEVIQGGTDTLSAYLLTRPGVDINWVSSFFGVDRETAERYVSLVRERGAEIRRRARERGLD